MNSGTGFEIGFYDYDHIQLLWQMTCSARSYDKSRFESTLRGQFLSNTRVKYCRNPSLSPYFLLAPRPLYGLVCGKYSAELHFNLEIMCMSHRNTICKALLFPNAPSSTACAMGMVVPISDCTFFNIFRIKQRCDGSSTSALFLFLLPLGLPRPLFSRICYHFDLFGSVLPRNE